MLIVFAKDVSDTNFVFSKYNNETGFENGGKYIHIASFFTLGYVCLIGLVMALFGITGFENGASLAEETV